MSSFQLRPRPLVRYRKPMKDESYKKWIREQPCTTAGRYCTWPIEAAHTKQDGQGGLASKTDDSTCIPLCSHCHRHGPKSYHAFGNEEKWAEHHGLKLPAIKADLRRRYMGEDFFDETCTD